MLGRFENDLEQMVFEWPSTKIVQIDPSKENGRQLAGKFFLR